MAKREQIETTLTCSICGKQGSVKWSENENPVHGHGYDQELINVPLGFHQAKDQLDESGDPKIDCDDCLPKSK